MAGASFFRTSLLSTLAALSPVLSLHTAQAAPKRVWTAEEILAERKAPFVKKNPRFTNGGVFKPCVFYKDVPTMVQYRPAVRECKGNAAIILSDRYLNIYSVVVRDYENKDRWPANGTNGCTPFQTHVLGLNQCSVFKVQKVIGVENTTELGDAEIHCLGASGYSKLFSRVRRITAKFQDVPGSNADPLARWCLRGPTQPLN